MTPDLQTKIADLLRAKHLVSHVARDLGVSVYVVRGVRSKLGISPRKRGDETPYLRRRRGEAVLLKRCGFTEEQIGQKMGGISRQRVSKMLVGLNVTVVCCECGEPTLRPHYFHSATNGVAPDVCCPGCAYGRLREKKERSKPMDARTKRFLTRHLPT